VINKQADQLHEQNVRKLIASLIGGGALAGAGIRGAMGFKELMQPRPTIALPVYPPPVKVPVPMEEEEEKLAANDGLLARMLGKLKDWNPTPSFAQNYSAPAFDPRVVGFGVPAAAGTGLVAYKGMDYLLDSRRKKILDNEVEEAQKSYEALMRDPNVKLASNEPVDPDAVLLDEIAEVSQKQAINWVSDPGGLALGGAGLYALTAGPAAMAASYNYFKKRSPQSVLAKALKQRALAREDRQVSPVFAEPVFMPVEPSEEKLARLKKKVAEKRALMAEDEAQALADQYLSTFPRKAINQLRGAARDPAAETSLPAVKELLTEALGPTGGLLYTAAVAPKADKIIKSINELNPEDRNWVNNLNRRDLSKQLKDFLSSPQDDRMVSMVQGQAPRLMQTRLDKYPNRGVLPSGMKDWVLDQLAGSRPSSMPAAEAPPTAALTAPAAAATPEVPAAATSEAASRLKSLLGLGSQAGQFVDPVVRNNPGRVGLAAGLSGIAGLGAAGATAGGLFGLLGGARGDDAGDRFLRGTVLGAGTGVGGGVGAGIGAGIGAHLGGAKGSLIGTGLGAAAGALGGNLLTRTVAPLQDEEEKRAYEPQRFLDFGPDARQSTNIEDRRFDPFDLPHSPPPGQRRRPEDYIEYRDANPGLTAREFAIAPLLGTAGGGLIGSLMGHSSDLIEGDSEQDRMERGETLGSMTGLGAGLGLSASLAGGERSVPRSLALALAGGAVGNLGGRAMDALFNGSSVPDSYEPKAASDHIPGGLADNKADFEFPSKSLQQGTRVEQEHTSDPAIAKEIAKDHLFEDVEYYQHLKAMEAKAGAFPGFGAIGKAMASPFTAGAGLIGKGMGAVHGAVGGAMRGAVSGAMQGATGAKSMPGAAGATGGAGQAPKPIGGGLHAAAISVMGGMPKPSAIGPTPINPPLDRAPPVRMNLGSLQSAAQSVMGGMPKPSAIGPTPANRPQPAQPAQPAAPGTGAWKGMNGVTQGRMWQPGGQYGNQQLDPKTMKPIAGGTPLDQVPVKPIAAPGSNPGGVQMPTVGKYFPDKSTPSSGGGGMPGNPGGVQMPTVGKYFPDKSTPSSGGGGMPGNPVPLPSANGGGMPGTPVPMPTGIGGGMPGNPVPMPTGGGGKSWWGGTPGDNPVTRPSPSQWGGTPGPHPVTPPSLDRNKDWWGGESGRPEALRDISPLQRFGLPPTGGIIPNAPMSQLPTKMDF
jgi:hypothetical protein